MAQPRRQRRQLCGGSLRLAVALGAGVAAAASPLPANEPPLPPSAGGAAAGSAAAACQLSIADFGAVAGATGSHAAFTNADAFNRTLAKAATTPGCTVVVPPGRFVTFGGIIGSDLVDTTLLFDGTLVAEFSTTQWPGCAEKKCKPLLQLQGARNLTLTSSHHFPAGFPTVPTAALAPNAAAAPIHPIRSSGGLIDGMGAKWWDWKLLTGSKCPSPMIHIAGSDTVLLEQLQLINSPGFHVKVDGSKDVEVRFIDIYVDGKLQRELRDRHAATVPAPTPAPATAAGGAAAGGGGGAAGRAAATAATATATARGGGGAAPSPPDYPPQNPAWLNTDGIDPAGKGFHIHHCSIVNDDDSIAVKPTHGPAESQPLGIDCSEDMLIEDMVMTGVGASIGVAKNAPLFLNLECFPYVCPEPVLAK